jgi:hypothetical protein
VLAVRAWAHAEAQCERFRAQADLLDAQLGEASLEEMLTGVVMTTGAETSEGPPQARARKDVESVVRERESLARGMHRAEMAAHTLRTAVWKRIALHNAGRRGPNLALIMAELDAEDQASMGDAG